MVAPFGRRPGDHVEQARRQSRLVEDLGDLQPRHRGELGWLQHKTVARGESQHDFLHREQEGRVEWRDPRNDAERLSHGEPELPRRGQGHGLAGRSAHFRRRGS
jgi:hypothetical protein